MAISEVELGVLAPRLTLSQRLGLRVRELRQGRGLTQAALAEVLGVDHSRVSRLENRAGGFDVAVLEQVAWALDADLVIELRPRAG